MKQTVPNDPYGKYISPNIIDTFRDEIQEVEGVPGLFSYGSLCRGESVAALKFASRLYLRVREQLRLVLDRRVRDREFIDQRMKVCTRFNEEYNIEFSSPDYLTPIGLKDGEGRVVFGPLRENFSEGGGEEVAPYPEHYGGPQVTLFGPPDSPIMAINAMNCYYRRLPGEPEIVERLLGMRDYCPRWGADMEDSKTPMRQDMAAAAENLSACFSKELQFHSPEKDRHYRIEAGRSALPVKRFPGLALPCGFLFLDGENFPLHIYDFAMHVYNNWRKDDALIFYVPKLENEEEAAYIRSMVAAAEELISEENPEYRSGTIRLMIVLENPRAILRVNEIVDALYPYFLGASLGWHDYLASAARLFRHEPHYRIPVKADPEIVIKHIKASHDLVARVVGRRGGLALGGMYGILPLESRLGSPSFTVALAGFFRDVITQLKRSLGGFWVAHPDFVRIGIALVIAWEERNAGNGDLFRQLAESMLGEEAAAVLAFADGDDICGLSPDDPMYIRELIVASLEESDFIPNNHPDEIRYNVFQTLQYLADWLSGNGCVALPAALGTQQVRIMDDLATTERSRWEVWHELAHDRFDIDRFMAIALEEMDFIRRDCSTESKVVRIKWDGRTAHWYPVAFHLMLLLMAGEEPVEFATELLLPFTLDGFRNGEESLKRLAELEPDKYRLPVRIRRYLGYYRLCGSHHFASGFASHPLFNPVSIQESILSFSEEQLLEAVARCGEIDASQPFPGSVASVKQVGLVEERSETLNRFRALADEYQEKFGFRFLVSATGKSAPEILDILIGRLHNDREQEVRNVLEALAEIALKRALTSPQGGFDFLSGVIKNLCDELNISAVSLAVSDGLPGKSGLLSAAGNTGIIQSLSLGTGTETLFDIASLSKSVATAFALEVLGERGYGLDTPVKQILGDLGSEMEICPDPAAADADTWAGELLLRHLCSHSGMNMHYVPGIACDRKPGSIADLLANPADYGYDPVTILNRPGSRFSYSGAGFLLLEYLCELALGDQMAERQERFVESFLSAGSAGSADVPGTPAFTFDRSITEPRIPGRRDDGTVVSDPPLWFPAFAAGCLANPAGMLAFLRCFSLAWHDINGCGPISHDTAVLMLKSLDRNRSAESRAFIGLDIGLGLFTSPMGENLVAVHQGANDGYRSIYFFIMEGPDVGKGFVIFATGDNKAVPAIARLSRELIGILEIRGFDPEACTGAFSSQGIIQEEIVNRGYRDLVFAGILPLLPDQVPADDAEPDPLLSHSLLAGSSRVTCSNERFARADNLVRITRPIFDPRLFCSQGKVMDSWETERHNPTGEDWVIFPLTRPAPVRFLYASTAYHDGNHVDNLALYGLEAGSDPALPGAPWIPVLPKTGVQGHSELFLDLGENRTIFGHVKICSYPDGGLSRIGLFDSIPEGVKGMELPFGSEIIWHRFSEPIPAGIAHSVVPLSSLPASAARIRPVGEFDLASALNGGRVEYVSNEHYGPASALISPLAPLHLFDGLESARSRGADHYEEVIIALGMVGAISRIELDFSYFVNNNPLRMDIHGLMDGVSRWREVAVNIETKPWAGNRKVLIISDPTFYSKIRARIYPDGGLNRLRVYGRARI